MELTWVAILASLARALATACVFIYAEKNDHFKNIEDTKYQIFRSDLDEHSAPLYPGRAGARRHYIRCLAMAR